MRLLICSLLLAQSMLLRAGDIDQLQTRADVENFLIKKVSKKFKEYPIFSEKAATDSAGLSDRFFKVDLNGDSATDLIVNGRSLWVILDKGKGHYSVHALNDGRGETVKLLGIDSGDGIKMLIVGQEGGLQPAVHKDTLVCYSGGFIEYNAAPAKDFNFQGISIRTSGCYGTCPVFEMIVDPDGTARYNALRFNKESGVFQGRIPKKEFADMLAVLRYFPMERLKDNYRVNWTDDQTITLEIRYNGQVKKIRDYGAQGTWGLLHLYQFFFRWADAVEWRQ